MNNLVILLTLLANSDYRQVHGKATSYYPGDGHCGETRADGRPFTALDAHIAHRRLPLGTEGFLCNARTGLCVETHVRDRGPWGAIHPCVEGGPQTRGSRLAPPRRYQRGKVCFWWQAQIKLKPGWKRRGEFDLTRPVAEAIGHRPFDKVVFFYKWTKRPLRSEV